MADAEVGIVDGTSSPGCILVRWQGVVANCLSFPNYSGLLSTFREEREVAGPWMLLVYRHRPRMELHCSERKNWLWVMAGLESTTFEGYYTA